MITAGLIVTGVAGLLLLVGALWFGTPLIVALVAFYLLMSAQGLIGPNAGPGGENTAAPVALIILVLVGVSMAALLLLTSSDHRQRRSLSHS